MNKGTRRVFLVGVCNHHHLHLYLVYWGKEASCFETRSQSVTDVMSA